jgi:hypothetical protein
VIKGRVKSALECTRAGLLVFASTCSYSVPASLEICHPLPSCHHARRGVASSARSKWFWLSRKLQLVRCRLIRMRPPTQLAMCTGMQQRKPLQHEASASLADAEVTELQFSDCFEFYSFIGSVIQSLHFQTPSRAYPFLSS